MRKRELIDRNGKSLRHSAKGSMGQDGEGAQPETLLVVSVVWVSLNFV